MNTSATEQIVTQSNPKDLKDELRVHIQDTIRSGVTDSKQVKASADAFIKSKINEGFIQKVIPKEPKSVKGFFSNVKGDTVEIIDGFGAMIGMTAKTVSAPFRDVYGLISGGQSDRTTTGIGNFATGTLEMFTSPAHRNNVYQTYVKPIVNEYKEYRHPLEKLYEDPLSVALDITAIFSGGASLAGKTSQIAKTSAQVAETAGDLGKAGILNKVAVGADAVANTLDKAQVFKMSNLSGATKSLISKVPGGETMLENWRLASEARTILDKKQTSFLATRNKILTTIDESIKTLSDEEVNILPKVIEGFQKSPVDASDNFYKTVGMVRALADDQARFGLKNGSLTNEIIERRQFQPLNNFLEKADTAEGELFRKSIDTSTPYHETTGAQLRGRIDTIKKFFPDADPIYMRHFFDLEPKKFSSFFLNTAPVRSFTPGFLKRSVGKDGYIGANSITREQLYDVLSRQASENLKFQKNIELVDSIKNHELTKVLKKGEEVLPGYRVFAPDGMINFYKATINMSDELSKVSHKFDGSNLEDIFAESGKNMSDYVFKDKTYVGVSKAKLYQVPEAIANEISKQVKATNPYIKLFYDKPMDAFRFSSLAAMPRWLVNNVIGNTMFSTIAGDIFSPKSFYIGHVARKAGLLPDELMAGMHRMERTTSGRLGAAAEIPMVKSSMMMHEAMLNTKVVGPIINAIEKTVNWGVVKPLLKIGNTSMKINEFTDDLFKGSAYVNQALKNERKGYIKRMTMNIEESLKILEGVKIDDAAREAALKYTHDWYYHGLGLTSFERRIVRRAIPFYSWWRWATLYTYHLATEAPIRTNIIANMSRDFYMMTGQNKLPESLRGSVPIGSDSDGTVYYLQTRGVNPFGMINSILAGDGLIGGTFTTALQSSSPAIKTAFEQATGNDVFLDRAFTREDIIEAQGGRLWRFDPETGGLKEVHDKVRPGLMENLLRNYIPQYLMLETVLTGGQQRYTAEGLDEILRDLYREPGQKKAIVEDVITRQGTQKVKFGFELYKSLGVNIKDFTSEDRYQREKAKEAATSALKNKLLPILNEDFKSNLKKKIMEEVMKGTPKDELKVKIKSWIVHAVTDLKNLQPKEKPQE